jgi:glycosyltransferase involved in cell wall biosynthesis
LYFAPYALFQRFYYPYYLNHTTVLCNSRFTQQALKSHFPSCGDNILYPPFDLDRFDVGQDNYRQHTENIVVTCSRFVPEKNLPVIPVIASISPDTQFHIFGGTNQYSGPVIEKILSEKQRLGCTNLHLHPDASTEEMVSMYRRAKVYLHTMVNEHFGISIVEGMAAGLVPVVHRSGGAYLDIIEKDKYGFSYETPEEAAEIIKSVIEDSRKQREYSHAALDRSRLFTKERFKREFLKIVMN